MKKGRASKTAEWVAYQRAYATLDEGADRVCDDPVAAAYVGLPLRASLAALRFGPAHRAARRLMGLAPFLGSSLYVPARVAFIDEALLRRAREGLDQLVLLGAGFDSRAERLAGDLAGVSIFEVDFPATQQRKLALRPPAPGVRYLPLDLAQEPFGPALERAGFDRTKRSAFIWEGVIYYLSPADGAAVLDGLRALLAPGGGLMLDYLLDVPELQGGALAAGLKFLGLVGEPILSRLRQEEVEPYFGNHGFAIRDRAEVPELERRYLRGANAGIRLPPIYGCLDLTAR